jgi:hypothetical protein
MIMSKQEVSRIDQWVKALTGEVDRARVEEATH